MKLCFSLSMFDIKFFCFCVLFTISEICINLFIYSDDNTIFKKNNLLDPFCYYVGFFLNIIPSTISNKCLKTKSQPIAKSQKVEEESNKAIEYIYNNPYDQYLSIKDILKFFVVCLFFLITDILEIIIDIINNSINDDCNNDSNEGNDEFIYEDDYLAYEFLIIYFLPKIFTDIVYYKHQNVSFFILFLIEFAKSIYSYLNYKNFNSKSLIIILLNIISSILFATCFAYIKGLMKYKFISPFKCCFMIGMVNAPLIIIISSIFSIFKEKIYDYNINIFKTFNEIEIDDTSNIIRLIIFPFIYSILMSLLTKTINDFTLYHIYIPFLIENFLKNIYNAFESDYIPNIILLSASFFIELIMILIFLEIIEVKLFGLNENIKKNIELRAMTESIIAINDNEDDDDDERLSIEKYNNISN